VRAHTDPAHKADRAFRYGLLLQLRRLIERTITFPSPLVVPESTDVVTQHFMRVCVRARMCVRGVYIYIYKVMM